MNNREIARYVNKTGNRMKLVVLIQAFQQAVFIGLVSAIALLLVSRLFVLPYYEFYSYATAGILFAAWFGLSARKLPSRHDAVLELDRFTPHNQLLTVWQSEGSNGLEEDLAKKTAEILPYSFKLFKKEPKHWLLPKWLLAASAASVWLALLLIFPSSSQQQAKEIEQEQEIIEDLAEKVEQAEKEAETNEVKEELRKLAEIVKESENAEEALKQVVKTQKELDLQEKELANKTTESLQQQKEEAGKAAGKLAEEAGKTQTALSNMGKPVSFPLQQTIAGSEAKPGSDASGSGASDEVEENSAVGSEEESLGTGQGENTGEGQSQGQGEGQRQGQVQGQVQGEGQGQGEGQSQGQSQGQGEGQSQGQGQGQGGGKGGLKGGSGQGSRELLTIPERIGGTAGPTVDSGEMGDGEAAEQREGEAPAARGTVHSYSEVVGSYSDSYFSSAEQMELPADLQEVVEQYFTSIRSDK